MDNLETFEKSVIEEANKMGAAVMAALIFNCQILDGYFDMYGNFGYEEKPVDLDECRRDSLMHFRLKSL